MPSSDVIEADIARESADDIVSALRALGIDHSGGITLEAIGTVLSDAAEHQVSGQPGDAVVWSALLRDDEIHAGQRLRGGNRAFAPLQVDVGTEEPVQMCRVDDVSDGRGECVVAADVEGDEREHPGPESVHVLHPQRRLGQVGEIGCATRWRRTTPRR